MIDAARIKQDFPALDQEVRGNPLVYLDSAATSQKPRAVLDALVGFYERDNANVHRGVHTLAERATEAYENARTRLATFLGAAPGEIVWTRNATEAINLVAHSYAMPLLGEGDEILVTVMEHHANLVPWHFVARATGAKVRAVPLREDFTLDLDRFHDMLGPRTRLVCFSMLSNTLGTINPAREMTEAAHRVGAKVVIDAAQAVPHMPVDVVSLDCDFLALSGHKMMGPTGIGALFGKAELLASMPPFLGGGEMIQEVRVDDSTYKAPPHRFEAGTPAIAEAVGLGAAVDYLTGLGMAAVEAYEQEITAYALDVLGALPGIRILGPTTMPRGGAVSFTLEGVHPHDLATILDSQGIAVRAGHHCTMPLHDALGVPASARASFYVYNTRDDADRLVLALDKAVRMFAGTA